MMSSKYFMKVLVVCIIVLFLGVGFQPALANEISTTTVSDVDEDCLECQPVNRIDLLKVRLLLIRVEVLTNILMQRFGHIPEIKEKCEEISNRISKLQVLNENSFICDFLWIIIEISSELAFYGFVFLRIIGCSLYILSFGLWLKFCEVRPYLKI